MPMLLKRTFSAWIDRMPGKQPRLIVTGTAETPTSGWSGTLVRAAQQVSPQILLLHTHLTMPTGPANPKISQIGLHYEELPAGAYTHVTVHHDGGEVMLEVDRTP